MKQVYGVWFPESDTHFESGFMHDNGDYQRDIFQAAMEYVKEPKIFYDIGAHVGLWSLMAIRAGFKEIHAYEPNPITQRCLYKNLIQYPQVNLYNRGVSFEDRELGVIEEDTNNSGAIKLTDKVTTIGPVYVSPIEYLERASNNPHECLVKIDTEGMEADCVKGMASVLYALRPVVCIEQRTNEDALKILQQMGMVIQKKVRKDWILTWE